MFQFNRKIFNTTFERKSGSKIELFNRQSGKWWYFEKPAEPFDLKADPNVLSTVFTSGFAFSFNPEMKKGQISYSGEVDLILEFDFLLTDVEDEEPPTELF
jgi:hypothetical protein